MRPAVSVVMPNFNHARFLNAALTAVTSQLHPGDELIVIDDASTDSSVELITKIIAGIPGARLIRHETNMGILATLNEGLMQAGNEYVCFPGADDIVASGTFDAALLLLRDHPEAGLCMGFVHVIDESGQLLGPLPTRTVLDRAGFLDKKRVAEELMRDDSWINGLTFYRTAFLREVGGFLQELSNFTDGFACRAVAVRHGCCFVPQPFHLWRRSSLSLSSQEMVDMEHVERIGRHTVQLMKTRYRADFPPGYASRWLGRWLFGARNYAIKSKQRRRWAGLLAAAERHGSVVNHMVQLFLALLRLPKILSLFFAYRPYDILAVVERRLLRRHSAIRPS